jgi:propanol-preferring alcohol dehydrogenase
MIAALLEEPRQIETSPLSFRDFPAEPPGPGELLLDIHACAICRTDLQICEGDIQLTGPVIPGHQAVGKVVAIGEGVKGWSPGERAGVAWLGSTCGSCRFCLSERENLCGAAQFTGWHLDGGFASVMRARADFAFRLPDTLSDELAAPLLCGGIIGYRSLRMSGITPGGRLGLYGFGASAHLAIQVALSWGCEVYVSTRSPREQQEALQMGAVWAGSYSEKPPRVLDAAVTFAPSGDVVLAALDALDRGGVVAINAIHLDRVPAFSYDKLWWERTIRSVANFTRADAAQFLALAGTLGINTPVQEFALTEANRALLMLKRGDLHGTGVLIP